MNELEQKYQPQMFIEEEARIAFLADGLERIGEIIFKPVQKLPDYEVENEGDE